MSASISVLAQGDAGAAAGLAAFLGFACLATIGLVIYFLPVVIAVMRGHQNSLAIFVLTLLLGWSFIGWVVALVWSFTAIDTRK